MYEAVRVGGASVKTPNACTKLDLQDKSNVYNSPEKKAVVGWVVKCVFRDIYTQQMFQ